MGLIFRRTVFDQDVLTLDEACFLEALAEGCHEVRGVSERGVPQETNNRHRRLLRLRRERPRCRHATEQRDELASSQDWHGLSPPRAAVFRTLSIARRPVGPWDNPESF